MAQLVARLVRNEKVGGSNPPSSTKISTEDRPALWWGGFVSAKTRVTLPAGYGLGYRPGSRSSQDSVRIPNHLLSILLVSGITKPQPKWVRGKTMMRLVRARL